LLGAVIGLSSENFAADEVVTGNLTVEGDVDIESNALSLGIRSDSSVTPGLTLLYADAAAPSIYLSASRGPANWFWQDEGGKIQMKLAANNKLQLFDQQSVPVAKIVLDPLGRSILNSALISSSEASISVTSGALTVAGGVGIAGDVYASSYHGDASHLTGITAVAVGLGNVSNTSDSNKPVSNAQRAALDLKADVNGSSEQDFAVKSLLVSSLQLYNDGVSVGPILTGDFESIFMDQGVFYGPDFRTLGQEVIMDSGGVRISAPGSLAIGSAMYEEYRIDIDVGGFLVQPRPSFLGWGYDVQVSGGLYVGTGVSAVDGKLTAEVIKIHTGEVTGVLRLRPSGDLSMGDFDEGDEPDVE